MARIRREEIGYKEVLNFWRPLSESQQRVFVAYLPEDTSLIRFNIYKQKENREKVVDLIIERIGVLDWPSVEDVFPDGRSNFWSKMSGGTKKFVSKLDAWWNEPPPEKEEKKEEEPKQVTPEHEVRSTKTANSKREQNENRQPDEDKEQSQEEKDADKERHKIKRAESLGVLKALIAVVALIAVCYLCAGVSIFVMQIVQVVSRFLVG